MQTWNLRFRAQTFKQINRHGERHKSFPTLASSFALATAGLLFSRPRCPLWSVGQSTGQGAKKWDGLISAPQLAPCVPPWADSELLCLHFQLIRLRGEQECPKTQSSKVGGRGGTGGCLSICVCCRRVEGSVWRASKSFVTEKVSCSV